ncbi:putative dehydrogenase [Micromonospora sp. Llam0]|uniref:Gfo/Idh/MocA family protein n=1 Tax=Micromonospora sp. Llam0 TaxID=2485143 RepID=UPI000F46EAB3|nr:Gfo/Idh/MocA family oxidoreductase [Micromonospora sp. Llam0]ROO60632.1 putative dehydrogenase [Micromonospora sp. Llam0]
MVHHGIIGCGRVAPNHVDGFRAAGRYGVGWACDRDARVLKEFALAHGIARSTTKVDEVLEDSEVISVSVAVDHAQHAALAERALVAGKHVVCEKPLALTMDDAGRLVALAAERDLVLSVISQHRYDPLVLEVRRWLQAGLLGRMLYAQVSLAAQREPEYYRDSYWRGTWSGEGGSALINQGYHVLDVTRLLLGELSVEAAVARTALLDTVMETEDNLSALLTAGPVPVTLNVTVAARTLWRTRIQLVGTQGYVEFDLDHPGTLHHAEGSPLLLEAAGRLREQAEEPPPPGVGYYGISHRRQIATFVEAVMDGRPREDPRAGLGMVELLGRLYSATQFADRRK